jgi:hypothetical protein
MKIASWSRRAWLLAGAAALGQERPKVGPLRVSPNRRFLVREDGSAFFYLGDTAWELFHRLTRAEIIRYLDKRAAQGFTVVQAVALAEFEGLTVPNAEGHLPLVESDPARPVEGYFALVDWVFDEAAKRGLYVGLLPTWGDKVTVAPWAQSNPVIFHEANARGYGRWMGARYGGRKNLIWILGGDRDPAKEVAVWRAMAEGIRETDTGQHLMTYHPNGRATSATYLHEEKWLDFNMLQSGHGAKQFANYEMIAADYARMPVKPCLDGEPRYENHPVAHKENNGWFNEYDVRQAAYWAVFAGAFGHTYGCHDVWQFMARGRKPVGFARGRWETSMELPGARQMGHLRRLMESRPMLSRVPDQSWIGSVNGAGLEHLQATRGDGYAMVYFASPRVAVLKLGVISGRRVKSWWFDPRTGKARADRVYADEAVARVQPPGGKDTNEGDWVLVLDDERRGFPEPGVPLG